MDHGKDRSLLKHQKLRVGGYTEEVFDWFDYLRASAHPGCEVGVCIVAWPVLRRGQSDGGESCIVLESGPTRSLVAKLPQRSSLVRANYVLQAVNKATDGVCVKP